jgi:hypothetical protein
MTGLVRKSAAALALLASVSMAATPALARDHGWGGGWGRHHDRVDAGDVLTGILIIGGIAAIASAAGDNGKRERERREREQREQEQRDYRGDDRQDSRGYAGSDDRRPEWNEGTGINSAIQRCTSEIERGDAQIADVEAVNKQGDGWRVEGRMAGGQSFACTVDRDGRIRSATVGGAAY